MTTSLDERFKVWVLVDYEEEPEEEEGEKKEKTRRRKKKVSSWVCRSVGYYHNLPCMDSSFSQDGSLLALNFVNVRALYHVVYSRSRCLVEQTITVWDPYLCELRQTFSSPHSDEVFK